MSRWAGDTPPASSRPFRAAFHGFDPEMVARYGEKDRARLLADAGSVRSPAKIDAAIRGAQVGQERGHRPPFVEEGADDALRLGLGDRSRQ